MKLGKSEEALLGFDAREMWLTPAMREVGLGGHPKPANEGQLKTGQ
jgi:hypothetical protein